MRTLTDEEQQMIKSKEETLALKNKSLKQYKKLAEELEYAVDAVEEGWIKDKREKLALKIKTLSNTLREIETLQSEA